MRTVHRIIGLGLTLLMGCQTKPAFVINGEIAGAENDTVYLEHVSMSNVQTLDSCVLDASGSFSFQLDLAESPEFYRLRLGNAALHFASDTSKQLRIHTQKNDFGKRYELDGSASNQDIKKLIELQAQTRMQADSVFARYKRGELDASALQQEIKAHVDAHKNAAKNIIFRDPVSPAAYFAIFQRLQDHQLFDPYDVSDNKVYTAVATSWETYYPESARTKHLVNLSLTGLREIRKIRSQQEITITELDFLHFFEISLPDIHNKTTSLSQSEGNVILLDFTLYQSEFSPNRNLKLREVYHRYAEQGFSVYQVSIDPNEHFWKTAAANLPWICVRDNRLQQSPYLKKYNVNQLPTYFLIDRSGNILARDEQIKDLDSEIKKLL